MAFMIHAAGAAKGRKRMSATANNKEEVLAI
jgi:hypothetical protein